MNTRICSSIFLVALLILTSTMPFSLADDEPELDSELIPTWVDCWMGHKSGNMPTEMQTDCDAYHTNSPTDRLYGIRWIFLNVSHGEIPDDWIDVQLTNLNGVFGQWNFQFQTDEVVVIPDAVAESDDYYQEWTLEEIMPDLRAQLNLSEDYELAMSELKSQLSERHVSQEELDNLTSDASFRTGGAFRLASRARAESITVVIRPNLDGSGMSGGPTPEFHHIRGGAVELSTSLLSNGGLTTFPHEVGHYFGISHSHAPDYDDSIADFGFEQRWGRLAHDGEAIKRVVGDDWSQPFGEPWVSYDDEEQSLIEFQELMGEAFLWPTWNFLYKGDHQNFESLADFIQYGESGETVYRKNFLRNYAFVDGEPVEWSGNNCIWNSFDDEGQCRYNEPVEIFISSHPSLNNSIFFENGTVSNLMSYITPPYDDLTSRRGITDTQLDMIRFTANTPFRLLLRNHYFANSTDIDEGVDEEIDEEEDEEIDEPDVICTPGESQLADDGCNTCVCTENEEWACTLIYCPDDVSLIPRISMWPGKVNQHNENGTWLTDPDGKSGGHSSADFPNDYGDRKLEYCQKFWPDTTSVYLLPDKEIITFYTAGNNVAYSSSKDVYQCVGANGVAQYNGTGTGEDVVDDVPLPGFGIPVLLSMLALVAIIRRRQNEN